LHTTDNTVDSVQMLRSIICEDPSHRLAIEMLRWFNEEVKPVSRNPEISKS